MKTTQADRKAAAAMNALDIISPRVEKRGKEVFKIDSVDQANLDLGFIAGFIDFLFTISGDGNNMEAVKSSSVAAIAYEATFKIDNLKKFINSQI